MSTDLRTTIEKYLPKGTMQAGDIEEIAIEVFRPLTPSQVEKALTPALVQSMGYKSVSVVWVNGPRGGKKTQGALRIRA
jgi:hypothetical protein